ncbi:MAG: hypothetical protein AAGG51_11935 [Cyanobacteria bacterium P01_G01_bin.54]
MPPSFTINLLQGSVSFSLAKESAQALQAALDALVQDLKAIAAQGDQRKRPDPKPNMEHRCLGPVFFEAFCNPNICASPFAAKVLITVRDEKIRLSGETELTRLREDLNQYLDAI